MVDWLWLGHEGMDLEQSAHLDVEMAIGRAKVRVTLAPVAHESPAARHCNLCGQVGLGLWPCVFDLSDVAVFAEGLAKLVDAMIVEYGVDVEGTGVLVEAFEGPGFHTVDAGIGTGDVEPSEAGPEARGDALLEGSPDHEANSF